jgi:protein-serine/threonine kinase
MSMILSGSPWAAAKQTEPNFKQFITSWNKWLEKHPDGELTDERGGTPACSPIFSAELVGSAAIRRLLLKMLHPDPSKRITIHDALTSPVVKNIECCAPESCDDNGVAIEKTISGDCTLANSKKWSKSILRKHSHFPPKEHKTPTFFQHRFDMGDGYR